MPQSPQFQSHSQSRLANPHSFPQPPSLHSPNAAASSLKSALTALVIQHHTALVYGGLGSTIFTSSHVPPASSTALIGFNAFNQSFFMATFMFLGGHYSRKSLQRKGAVRFIFDRVRRLALPAVVYTVFVHPVSYAVVQWARRGLFGATEMWRYWRGLRGLRGPVWFLGTLFAFDLGLVGVRWVFQTNENSESKSESRDPPQKKQEEGPGIELGRTQTRIRAPALLAALTTLSATEFLVRTRHSLLAPSAYLPPLSLCLGYAPQYLAAYIFGACTPSLSSALPSLTGTLVLLPVSLLSTLALARADILSSTSISQMAGGHNALAAWYAIWGNFTGYLMGSGLLGAFLRWGNGEGEWRKGVNGLAFGAFLVHMPVSTAVEMLVERWWDQIAGSVVLKALGVGMVNVVLSWGAAWGIRETWERLWAGIEWVRLTLGSGESGGMKVP